MAWFCKVFPEHFELNACMNLSNFCILFFTLATLISCKNIDDKNQDSGKVREVYSEFNYSDSLIVTEQFQAFYKAIGADSFLVRNVSSFYNDRGSQMAWSVNNELTAAADNLYERIMEHMYAARDSQPVFLKLRDSWSAPLRYTPQEISAPVYIDLLLTASYFKYAEKTYSGSVQNLARLEWYIPRKKINYAEMLDMLLEGKSDEQPLQNNTYYQQLKQHLVQYRVIQDAGGLPRISDAVSGLKLNESNPGVPSLRKYLYLTGDLSNADTTEAIFDKAVAEAVGNFQMRCGYEKTDELDDKTLLKLNVPVENIIMQIMVNMERMRWFSKPDSASDFLLVNIPDYQLRAFENNKLQWEMDVVVGTTANRTTVFKGMLSQVVLNPYWNVPQSIIDNEMLEHLKDNPGKYTASQNLEVLVKNKPVKASSVDWSDPEEVQSARIRQLPGDANSLGRYKFLFPNSFSIYLHDSPAKHLFDKDKRTFSHGCIRVAEPEKLANYLLRDIKEWSPEKVKKSVGKDEEIFINLKKPLPVYIVYFTAWVDDKGKLNLRDDPYEHDKKLEREIYVKAGKAS